MYLLRPRSRDIQVPRTQDASGDVLALLKNRFATSYSSRPLEGTLTSTNALDLSMPLSSTPLGASGCRVNVSVRYAPMSGRPKLTVTGSVGLWLTELMRRRRRACPVVIYTLVRRYGRNQARAPASRRILRSHEGRSIPVVMRVLTLREGSSALVCSFSMNARHLKDEGRSLRHTLRRRRLSLFSTVACCTDVSKTAGLVHCQGHVSHAV